MTLALKTDGLMKTFGALRATDNVCLDIRENECHAIIGPNGAGKTTLIGQITGELVPDSGSVSFFGTDVTGWSVPRRALAGLGRSFQITQLCMDFSALDNVALAVQASQGHSYRFLHDARNDASLREPARAMLKRVGLEHRANEETQSLSHGERRQVELACALAMQPRILVLDEPMAGMGPQESLRMIEILQALRGEITILLVEHDMDAVFALADRISVLVNGAIIATDTPDVIRADARVRAAYLGSEAH
jgi:branched-chain amino acid transport system ATP-binding protein